MTVKKIIPCLDVMDGRVVKGIKFANMVDAGDAATNAVFYEKAGADEITFLDITATCRGEKTVAEMVRKVADSLTIPFAVGGGISSLSDIERVLNAGADKVGINTAAVRSPELISQAAERFGTQRVVVAVDAKKEKGHWVVYTMGGQRREELDAVEWSMRCERLGAGEILLTSVDRDGTKDGYDFGLTEAVSKAVGIPVTASGGAGKREHFMLAFDAGATSALAASLFHFREIDIGELKAYLKASGINVK